jgi:hypothetical protein
MRPRVHWCKMWLAGGDAPREPRPLFIGMDGYGFCVNLVLSDLAEKLISFVTCEGIATPAQRPLLARLRHAKGANRHPRAGLVHAPSISCSWKPRRTWSTSNSLRSCGLSAAAVG